MLKAFTIHVETNNPDLTLDAFQGLADQFAEEVTSQFSDTTVTSMEEPPTEE